jgi:hypothetical protein
LRNRAGAAKRSGWCLSPQDHRDKFNGGFAFSVFHPGTSVLTLPFSVSKLIGND